MKKERKRVGIILQVAILFLVSVLTTGFFTYYTQYVNSDVTVKTQTETLGSQVADEVIRSVKEYPAYKWLLSYWHRHYLDLEIEYDVEFGPGTQTESKYRLLNRRQPKFPIKYASAADIEALPKEDQKLYAEIVYSWLTTRINQIKRSYEIDYLFCVMTDVTYKTQFFVLSAADPGAVRGTTYEEVYTLGTKVEVSADQQAAMSQAHSGHLVNAGNYVDYYAFLGMADGNAVLVGMTYDQSTLRADIEARTRQGTFLAMLHQVGLSLICLALIYLFVLRPLKKVQQNIRLYKQTKDSRTVTRIRASNEIGQLSEDVVGLAQEIDDYLNRIETITAREERIGAELALASRIQANSLPNVFPPFPERKEFDIYASMTPAKEVGGDFYDFFMIDDDHLALVIADVSGKGVPASLFMMVSMILMRNTALSEMSPARTLETVNGQICANNPEEMFVSVWLGVLEISTGKLTAANAGHEYPVLKRADGSFALLKDRHGFVIGGMAGMKYQEYELQLEPGAKLFLYTDGVPEATNAAGEFFGLERTVEALRRREDGSPEEILGAVNDAVQAFVGDALQFDDLTMLCVHYAGPGAAKQEGPGAH